MAKEVKSRTKLQDDIKPKIKLAGKSSENTETVKAAPIIKQETTSHNVLVKTPVTLTTVISEVNDGIKSLKGSYDVFTSQSQARDEKVDKSLSQLANDVVTLLRKLETTTTTTTPVTHVTTTSPGLPGLSTADLESIKELRDNLKASFPPGGLDQLSKGVKDEVKTSKEEIKAELKNLREELKSSKDANAKELLTIKDGIKGLSDDELLLSIKDELKVIKDGLQNIGVSPPPPSSPSQPSVPISVDLSEVYKKLDDVKLTVGNPADEIAKLRDEITKLLKDDVTSSKLDTVSSKLDTIIQNYAALTSSVERILGWCGMVTPVFNNINDRVRDLLSTKGA